MLNKSERMLFALLRASLHNSAAETVLFENVSKEDWGSCYKLATVQGVLALAWEGVLSLPVGLHPYKQLKFQWAMSVDKYEAKHKKYCSVAHELQQFYREHGIVAVQMKGVGFSSYYNCPSHREGGDIDIYTYSANAAKMSNKEANELADSLMGQQDIDVDIHTYKHSNFDYKGIPIENHRCFVDLHTNPKFLGKLNEILDRLLNPEEVNLYGEYKIIIPSKEFNTIFIPCHAFQHYGSGIALHHLYDWATILYKYGLNLPKEITEEYFLRAIAAFTHLSNKFLGTNIDVSTFPSGYEKLADEMLMEMLYPKFPKVLPKMNPVSIIYTKARRLFANARYSKKVLGSRITRTILNSFMTHISNPKNILNRGEI